MIDPSITHVYELSTWDEDHQVVRAKCYPKKAFCKRCEKQLLSYYPNPYKVVLASQGHVVSIYARVVVIHKKIWSQIVRFCPGFVSAACLVQLPRYDDPVESDFVSLNAPPPLRTKLRAIDKEALAVFVFRCPVCSWCGYIGGGTEYVLRGSLPDAHVWAEPTALILSPHVVEAVDWSEFPDVNLRKIPVHDRSLDGVQLPGDPDWSKMP